MSMANISVGNEIFSKRAMGWKITVAIEVMLDFCMTEGRWKGESSILHPIHPLFPMPDEFIIICLYERS